MDVVTIMPTRIDNLEATLDAFRSTGVPLVSRLNGAYVPAGLSDDPGLSLVVPPVASALGMGAYDAAQLILLVIVAASVIAGSWGIVAKWRTAAAKVIGVTALVALGAAMIAVGDVYVVPAGLACAFGPWMHGYAVQEDYRGLLRLAPLIGVCAAAGDLMRSHAGTGLLLVYLLYLVLSPGRSARRIAVATLLVAIGFAAPVAAHSLAEMRRDAFLASQPRVKTAAVVGHPFWHTAYIGLGDGPNEYGIEYRDEWAIETAARLAPGSAIGSEAYEQALKGEFLRIARTDPGFVAWRMVRKAVWIGIYFIAAANLGLLALLLSRPRMGLWLPFAVGIAFTSLPSFIAVPTASYLLGLVGMSCVAGIAWDEVWLAARAAHRSVSPRTHASTSGLEAPSPVTID